MNRFASWVATLLVVGIPVTLIAGAEAPVHVQYEEVSAEIGFDFLLAGEQSNGDALDPWPAFPEIMGAGACWFDYDGDGYEDLYVVNQRYNEQNLYALELNEERDPHNKLFRNMGDGTLREVSAATGTDSRAFGYGCTAADYDDDGDLDLLVTGWGDSLLLRNDGGRFTDVSEETGINPPGRCGAYTCMSITSAWADYDLDGDLDVFIGNYVDTTMYDNFRGPLDHAGQLSFLMRNDDGVFTNVAPAAGVAGRDTGLETRDKNGSKTLGVVWFDADLDGDHDLYIANDMSHNEFYVNRGDGTFDDASVSAGLDDAGASMGVTTGDYDQDGYPDLFFTHYSHQPHGFYRNNGDLTFERRSGEDGQANIDGLVGWGTTFLDVERDGDLDIFAVFGHTEPFLDDYHQPSKLYYNEPGDGTPGDRLWVDGSADAGPGMSVLGATRGAAFADYDLDGDTDVVLINQGNVASQFLRAEGIGNNWLSILLRQPAPNVHAIGARVIVEAQGQAQTMELQAGSSYESQNSQRLDFGLGDAAVAERVTVHWPGGAVTEILDVAANQAVRILSDGTLISDTLAPVTAAALEGLRDDQGWWQTDVEVVLETVDRNVGTPAGVASVEYRRGDGPWLPYTGSFMITEEGTHTVETRSVDLAGNEEPVRRFSFTIDNVAPTASHEVVGTPGENDWWVGDQVEVRLSAADSLSGVDAIRYRVDGGAWQDYGAPIAIDEAGTFNIEYRAIDRAGNVGDTGTVQVAFDNVVPFVRVQSPVHGNLYVGSLVLPWLGQEVAVATEPTGVLLDAVQNILVGATDSHSGIERVEFRVGGALVHVDEAAPFEFDWDISDASPQRVLITARAFDEAGNEAQNGVLVRVLGGIPL